MSAINATNPLASVSTGSITGAQSARARRKAYGEVVGNVFYGTLLKQMNESKIKGNYFHGGRGEDAFRGQLALELGKRMGQSPTDPLVNRMFEAAEKRLSVGRPGAAIPVNTGAGFDVQPARSFSTEPPPAKVFPARTATDYPAWVGKERLE